MYLLYVILAFGILNASYASYDFFTSEVFVLPLSPLNFSLVSSDIVYRPSVLNLPDLPSWLLFTYSPATRMGYVYGAPPSGQSSMNLEVIAMDRTTYNTSRRIFNLNIHHDSNKQYEVEFKISNLNIDELLIGGRLDRLLSVITEHLWPESGWDGRLTSLTPASLRGDRLPLNPSDREGVYVSYGSSTSFSYSLRELEMEVKPLWNHRPCPKYFKKASYERYFRMKGFAVDWCSFKLHEQAPSQVQKAADSSPYSFLKSLQHEPVTLMKKTEVVTRSYVLDVINTLLIPLLVMLVLLAFLTLAMCCHRTDMDLQSSVFFHEIFDDFPRMPTMHDIQMVQYAGLPKPTAISRMKKFTKGESPHPSLVTTTTQMDTLPRSQTTSPVSTLNRTTPSRRFEDYETLSRPNPPPYQRKDSSQM